MIVGPKTLQISLLKRLIGPFLFVFLTIMFLLLLQFLMLYIDKIVGKGLPLSVIFELIFSNLAYMVVLAVPMAVLVSTLMVFGSFSETYEFTALRAAGIHPFRIITPVALIGFLLFISMVFFSNYILPEANYRARALFIDIRLKKPGFDLKEGVFYDGIEGYTFLVRSIPNDSDSLYDIHLFQEPRDGKDEARIKARKGVLQTIPGTQNLNLVLFDGQMFRTLLNRKTGKHTLETTSFGTYTINFDLSKLEFSRSNPESRGRNDRTMRAEAMLEVVSTIHEEMKKEADEAFDRNKSVNLQFKHIPETIFEADSNVVPVQTEPQLQPIESVVSIQPTITYKKEPKRESAFVAMNQLSDFDTQREIIRTTIRGIRTRAVNYDGIRNTIRWKTERISKYWVEIHKKLAIPIGCIIFVFIGAPLGLLSKKGNLGIAAVFAALIFTVYWIGLIQGEKLADRLIISPTTGMWFINVFFVVIAIFLNKKIISGKVF